MIKKIKNLFMIENSTTNITESKAFKVVWACYP